MKNLACFLMLLGLMIAGCGKRPDSSPPPPPSPTTPDFSSLASPIPAPPASEGNPSDILVEIDGAKITRGDAQLETNMRIGAMKNSVPPTQIPSLRRQVMRSVVNQFVAKMLLLAEAKRLNIAVTPDDEKEAYDTIRSQLPPGKNLDEVLKNSPIGEERMRQEVTTGIMINKLLTTLLTNELSVSDADVAAFYSDLRHARHILLECRPTDDPKIREDKRAKADSIRKQLLDGADFSELARLHSDCPSRQRGGDLGPFPRGKMDPTFEKAAFTQKPGEIGPVVETRFGYHIIQVMELDKAKTVSEENVRKHLVQQRKLNRIDQVVEGLKAKTEIKYDPEFAPRPPPSIPSEHLPDTPSAPRAEAAEEKVVTPAPPAEPAP